MLNGNIIILVQTPIPARTESEMFPARSLSIMLATTASPLLNIEDDPTVITSYTISFVGLKLRSDKCSILRRVMYGKIRIEKLTSCEIAVASDAPATPISSPKIKIGSRMQLRIPPKPMPIIESVALPSERRH